MNAPTAIARDVRADVRNAIDHRTLTLPEYVTVAIRADRRGLAPTVNASFRAVDGTDGDVVDAWKYTIRPDGIQVLSDEIKAAGTAIIQMIKNRSDGQCYGEINCAGTIVAILVPRQDGKR